MSSDPPVLDTGGDIYAQAIKQAVASVVFNRDPAPPSASPFSPEPGGISASISMSPGRQCPCCKDTISFEPAGPRIFVEKRAGTDPIFLSEDDLAEQVSVPATKSDQASTTYFGLSDEDRVDISEFSL
ncbi:MAG: hypothetical protein IPM23_24885 [Candidatus Melainabacteria bacterium]|nr:hypothetical protein [Candidatus Melainabacteria bacterium]